MVVKDLSDVFVASGVEMVNDTTFTALFHGYELRGKIRVPTIPTVEFFFFGNVYIDDDAVFSDFVNGFEEKFGHAKFRFTDKFVSILLDIGSLDAAALKERLGAVSGFMMGNNFGAIGLQPEEPEPEPEPPVVEQPKPKPAPKQVQQQKQQPVAPPPVQKPVPQEPAVPFEEHKVLEKLTQMFILGINQVGSNTFTTIYHGYNVVGKMLSPIKDDIEIIFYGELMKDVSEDFEKLRVELNEKYGMFPIRMVGGSCDAILYLDGKDVGQCKQMLGEISGFMMRNSIVAVNLPSSVGRTIKTFNEEYFKNSRPSHGSGYSSQRVNPTPSGINVDSSRGYSQPQPNSDQMQQDNFVGKFLKKFSKKP